MLYFVLFSCAQIFYEKTCPYGFPFLPPISYPDSQKIFASGNLYNGNSFFCTFPLLTNDKLIKVVSKIRHFMPKQIALSAFFAAET